MVDIVKTKAQLLTEDFAANANTGAIRSPQFRNFVVSAMGCYGGITTNVGTQSFTLLDSVYQDLKPFQSATPSDTLTLSAANGTIVVPSAEAAGPYDIHVDVQMEPTTVIGTTYAIKLSKNGVQQCVRGFTIPAASLWGGVAFVCPLALVNADSLALQILSVGGAVATLIGGTFFARRIG